MYKPDENNIIDRLSREAAEHYRAPGSPEWESLRKALDKEMPEEKERKRRGFFFIFLLALGLLTVGAGAWYAVHMNAPVATIAAPVGKKQQPLQQAQSNIGNTTKKNANQFSNTTPDTSSLSRSANAPGSAAVSNIAGVNRHEANQNDKDAGLSPVSTPQQHLRPRAASDKAKRYPVASSVTRNTVKTRAGRTGRPNAANTEDTDDAAVSENTGSSKTEIPVNEDTASRAARQEPAVLQHLAAAAPAAASPKTDSVKANSPTTKSASRKEKAVVLGLTAGLDLSTVRFTYASRSGYNIGLMGGYEFSPHWSVYTGLVYTKKNYKLGGNDYHPPEHYWTSYVNLQTVEGYCRMWDLPLLARYTFNPRSKTAFFASAGVSSYFMKKQQYEYSYKTVSGMSGTSAWTNDSSFNHIFSILDLSAGFEKRIGRHMNWQIEPYAKIPLGGIGFGNIRLSSFGVNLTVQYRKPIKH